MTEFENKITKWLELNKTPEADQWAELIVQVAPRFGITTKEQLAMFLAQGAHESNYFKSLSENLNYSASGLRATWPSRFDAKTAEQFARQPEKIANRVYSSRMGNGDEASGDGWEYRGRGIFQLTGRSNYTLASQELYNGRVIADNPEAVAVVKIIAVETAMWFWQKNNLSKLGGDVAAVTKKINGGTTGLKDREAKYKTVLALLDK